MAGTVIELENDMFRTLRIIAISAVCVWIATLATAGSAKRIVTPVPVVPKQVDLVIALDVSGSMSGLIESAKQRLWDIVNEFGQAQPQPDLRVAILTYGNPSYGAQTGYVRINQPFTRDLDAVSETLFSFGTNGGEEYVARAIDTSVRSLDWSKGSGAVRVMFVAGNEPATQDPVINLSAAADLANAKDIVVNTIYCGPEGDGLATGWNTVANLTQGIFASIDQNAAAVANVATPMDNELAKLNEELNETYIAFGRQGKEAKEKQEKQDEKTADLSAPAAASRTVTKSTSLYNNASWDLVDAVKAGQDIEELEADDLPEEMQVMSVEERSEYVVAQTKKRENLQLRIQELGQQRRDYIAEQKTDSDNGLDDAILEGIRQVAGKKGLALAE